MYTKVQKLDRLEKFVLGAEVLSWPLGAVIFDVWKAAGSKYMIIAVAYWPIEVGHPSLIVHNVGILDKIRSPWWLVRLQEITR